ncbi:MAG: bifunctional diaminohydroxyphosphoribosylaminopyrimidine deaminase/5-amino-6-(5-phosphoribosylamino)uracil reductase RibD [Deltaproteobacteria bacterium]
MAKRSRNKDERDQAWMDLALEQADAGRGRTSPNPAVGCVLVRGACEVGRGHHARFGGPHAEAVALGAAAKRARGATAYVTLEPCCISAKTPPCTRALIEAGVDRVVVGCRDPNPEVAGRGLAELRRAGIEVTFGVLGDECKGVIAGFESWVTRRRPRVHLKLATTLDGRIATRTGASQWISGAGSRRLVQDMRRCADAVLVGVGTVQADDPRLSCRLPGARQPLRVILDSALRTPAGARAISGPGDCLLVGASTAPATKARRLEAAGAEVLLFGKGGAKGKRGWGRVLTELGRRGVLELLIEGGAEVAASALRAGVVNDMTIFYNPRFIGGDGVPMLAALGVRDPREGLRPTNVSWAESDGDLVWRGSFK